MLNVRERQPISRIDIAAWTGLEGSTVSKIVSRLLDNEFVYEDVPFGSMLTQALNLDLPLKGRGRNPARQAATRTEPRP